MSRTLQLAEELIARPSVTPEDAQCLEILEKRLSPLGFICERLDRGPAELRVRNLWAIRRGRSANSRTVVFAGHTDVVPTGPLNAWTSPPFTPTHRNGNLYGRGASDMKTSIAAMVVACEELLADLPNPDLSIAFLLTSDEEGPSVDGTVKVCDILRERGERLHWCIVGEPTSLERTGDMIKNGRRGTMSARLVAKGVQGHVAYPHLAKNPIHLLAPVLAELAETEWDRGNASFPPTTWQASNIHAGTGATNVIPGECVLDFNFRFSTESTPESLQQRLTAMLDRHGLQYDIQWILGGLPFLTGPSTGDSLIDVARAAIREESGIEVELSTSGGTSDGRFIAKICPQVIELGPPGLSIHKIDEYVPLAEIEPLKNIYRRILTRLENSGIPGQT
jgi:succinyl-diaminopimelate desuccinylase